MVLAALAGCGGPPEGTPVDTEVPDTDADIDTEPPAELVRVAVAATPDLDAGLLDQDLSWCPDSDDDGVCDLFDRCVGPGVERDADADGLCQDLDPCFGDDATGDDDGDAICEDLDICVGDDLAGDADADAWCDDVDPCRDDVVAPGTSCEPPTSVPTNPCHGVGIFVDGRNSGLVRCADGAVDRLFATSGWLLPESLEPRNDNPSRVVECHADADCTAAPYGTCLSEYDSYYEAAYYDRPSNRCYYRCDSDADCSDDQLCRPPDTVGVEGWSFGVGLALRSFGLCLPAGCRTGADCASGRCGYHDDYEGCASPSAEGFACRVPAVDACEDELDCASGVHGYGLDDCSFDGSAFVCSHDYITCGRPLLDPVGAPIFAPVVIASGGWAGAVVVGVPASRKTRRVVASHWAQVGAFEHASVASFARHALQLMALGAPADLLSEVTAAMADEVRHAQVAFGVAAALGLPAGPGPMPVDRAELHGDVDAVLVALVREGCVGETIAATEAAWLADRCVDVGLRQVLTTIAADEARHAALAWRTVAWLVDGDAARLARVQALVAEALSTPAGLGDAEGLVGWGLIDAAGRAAVRVAVVADVIGPATAALAA